MVLERARLAPERGAIVAGQHLLVRLRQQLDQVPTLDLGGPPADVPERRPGGESDSQLLVEHRHRHLRQVVEEQAIAGARGRGRA